MHAGQAWSASWFYYHPSCLLISLLTQGCMPACLPACYCACRAVLLKMEEEWIQKTCEQIAAFKPDIVITGGCGLPPAPCSGHHPACLGLLRCPVAFCVAGAVPLEHLCYPDSGF